MNRTALRVASICDYGPEWRWFEPLHAGEPPLEHHYYSTAGAGLLTRLPGLNWGRVRAALQLRDAIRRGAVDFVASHSPRNSYYASAVALKSRPAIPHVAFAFNFTNTPTGLRLSAMRKAFARIQRFGVFTQIERSIYADLFEVPLERFHFTRWGVAPPIAAPLPRAIDEPYVIAIGGEARDYRTFVETARRMPKQRFVAVVRPDSFEGLNPPDNVTVLTNRPWVETWSLAAHAEALLIPLRSSETPNGIVTIVGGMNMGVPLIVTDSLGVHDYMTHEETGLLAPVGDSAAFARGIEQLRDDPALARRLTAAGKHFAETYCSEQVAADFSLRQIVEVSGLSVPPRHAQKSRSPSTSASAAR